MAVIYMPKRQDAWAQMLPQILGQMVQTKFQHNLAMDRADKDLELNKQLQDYKLKQEKERIGAQAEKEKAVIQYEADVSPTPPKIHMIGGLPFHQVRLPDGNYQMQLAPRAAGGYPAKTDKVTTFEHAGKRWQAVPGKDGIYAREIKTESGQSLPTEVKDPPKPPTPQAALRRITELKKAKGNLDKTDRFTAELAALFPDYRSLANQRMAPQLKKKIEAQIDREIAFNEQFAPHPSWAGPNDYEGPGGKPVYIDDWRKHRRMVTGR